MSDKCDIHGAYERGPYHALCPDCWNGSRKVRRRLPLHLAGPGWWRIHDAIQQHQSTYMGDCEAHGFTEHSISRGCLKCVQGAPVLLRPA